MLAQVLARGEFDDPLGGDRDWYAGKAGIAAGSGAADRYGEGPKAAQFYGISLLQRIDDGIQNVGHFSPYGMDIYPSFIANPAYELLFRQFAFSHGFVL
jgi:hypothetical protein